MSIPSPAILRGFFCPSTKAAEVENRLKNQENQRNALFSAVEPLGHRYHNKAPGFEWLRKSRAQPLRKADGMSLSIGNACVTRPAKLRNVCSCTRRIDTPGSFSPCQFDNHRHGQHHGVLYFILLPRLKLTSD